MQTGPLHLLSTKRFLPLFIVQFLGAFNDNLFKNALIILLTYKLADNMGYNPQVMVTIASAIFILPFFLFSAIAGQIADKFEKSRVIKILKFAELLIIFLAVYGFFVESIDILMSVLFLLGIQAAFFGPLKYSIIPDHLEKSELASGNGLIEASTFISILVGTILGGVFIMMDQAGVVIICGLLIACAIAGFIMSLEIPETSVADSSISINPNFVAETFNIIAFAKNNRSAFLSIIGISWFWLVGAVFLSQFPNLVKYQLNGNAEIITLLLAMFAIGIAFGSLICAKIMKGQVTAKLAPIGSLGISIFSFYLVAAIGIYEKPEEMVGISGFLMQNGAYNILLSMFLVSVFGGIYTVPLYSLLQVKAEESHRSRTIAANNIMNALFMVTAALVTSIMLLIGMDVSTILFFVAIANLAICVIIMQLMPDEMLRGFFTRFFKLLYRVEVKGLENYHAAGDRVLIISNHISFLDAALIATFLPDKLTFPINSFIAKSSFVRPFLNLVEVLPLDQTNPMSLKKVVELFQSDKRVVIFPEGRISVTGNLMKIYDGTSLIADKAKVQLLPIRIEGAELTHFSRLTGIRKRLFPKITIHINPAQDAVPDDIPANISYRHKRKLITDNIYQIMTKMRYKIHNEDITIPESLFNAAKKYGFNHQIAMDIFRNHLSYKTLFTKAIVLGEYFKKSLKNNDFIGLILPTSLASVVSVIALQLIGKVPAMLNFTTGSKAIIAACTATGIKQIVTSRTFAEKANLIAMFEELSKQIEIIYLEDVKEKIGLKTKLYAAFYGYQPRNYYHKTDANKAAIALFTSGSEGTPKAVILSHKNILANCAQISSVIDFTANDKIFNALPIFHSFSLTAGTLLPMIAGVKIFLYPSPLHAKIIPEQIYDINATIFFATNSFLKLYAKKAHPYDFYSIRYIFAGAEKLKSDVREIYNNRYGVRIFEGYGATETSPVIAVNTPLYNKISTVGKILPGIEYLLEQVEGVTNGGKLLVKGDNIMLGYMRHDAPLTLAPPLDGWYDTGDIVEIDDEGYVKIIGRAKRFAKIAGEMISLTAIEEEIAAIWKEDQHAVIAQEDEKKGEILVLFTEDKNLTREIVANALKQKGFAEIYMPRNVIHIEKIPLLATGKVNYQELK